VSRLAGAALVALLAAGCGAAAREAAPVKCLVHVYFCTGVTCARAATKAQMQRVEAELRANENVFAVRFISKKQALEIMRKRQPEMVASLHGVNPFPDALRVRPVKGTSPEEVAATVHEGRDGVDQLRYERSPDCS
jgi:cell division protein FtsX